MLHLLYIINKKRLKSLLIIAFICAITQSYGQDTLAGNYPFLSIKSGNHIIRSVVTVKGKLDIEAGAKIELIDCEKDKEMCAKYEVQGFPTLLLHTSNGVVPYNGNRSGEAIAEFVTQNK